MLLGRQNQFFLLSPMTTPSRSQQGYSPWRWQKILSKSVLQNQGLKQAYITKPAQVGLTTAMLHSLIVPELRGGKKISVHFPNDQMSRHYSKSQAQPALILDPELDATRLKFSYDLMRYQNGGELRVLSNTSKSFRGYTSDVEILDEYAAYRGDTGDGSPSGLARARLRNQESGRLVAFSSPSSEGDALAIDMSECPDLYDFRMPCEVCQQLTSIDYSRLTNDAKFQCEPCLSLTTESIAKRQIAHRVCFYQIGVGEVDLQKSLPERIGVQLSILLNPNISWRDLKREEHALARYEDQVAFNSTVRGRPRETLQPQVDIAQLRKRATDIPIDGDPYASYRTLGIDVSLDRIHYCVSQITKTTMPQVLAGDTIRVNPLDASAMLETLSDLRAQFSAKFAFIDCGYMTQEIRGLCAQLGWLEPVMGVTTSSTVQPIVRVSQATHTTLVQATLVKDYIFQNATRLQFSTRLTQEFFDSVFLSEYRDARNWKLKRTYGAPPNHLLDAFVYSLTAPFRWSAGLTVTEQVA